jgi:hypothetical protein
MDWLAEVTGFEPLHFRNEFANPFENPRQYRGD